MKIIGMIMILLCVISNADSQFFLQEKEAKFDCSFTCEKKLQIERSLCLSTRNEIEYCNIILDFILDKGIENFNQSGDNRIFFNLISNIYFNFYENSTHIDNNLRAIDPNFMAKKNLAVFDEDFILRIKFALTFKISEEDKKLCSYLVEWKEPFERQNMNLTNNDNDPRCNLVAAATIFHMKAKFSKTENYTETSLRYWKFRSQMFALRNREPYFYKLSLYQTKFPTNTIEIIKYNLWFKKNYIRATSTQSSTTYFLQKTAEVKGETTKNDELDIASIVSNDTEYSNTDFPEVTTDEVKETSNSVDNTEMVELDVPSTVSNDTEYSTTDFSEVTTDETETTLSNSIEDGTSKNDSVTINVTSTSISYTRMETTVNMMKSKTVEDFDYPCYHSKYYSGEIQKIANIYYIVLVLILSRLFLK